MYAYYNGTDWCIRLTSLQYLDLVIEFFARNPKPTCDELKDALVPTGVPDTATGNVRFNKNDIYKYVFYSKEGDVLLVKYHNVDRKVAADYPDANAAKGWTAQIVCGYCCYFTWDAEKEEAGFIKVKSRQAKRGIAPSDNAAHIPMKCGPQ